MIHVRNAHVLYITDDDLSIDEHYNYTGLIPDTNTPFRLVGMTWDVLSVESKYGGHKYVVTLTERSGTDGKVT